MFLRVRSNILQTSYSSVILIERDIRDSENMMLKLLTYASFIVAASAYYNHQVPVPISHTPYHGNHVISGRYGYHGNYIGQNYGYGSPSHEGPANPWIIPPSVHNNVNPNNYQHGEVYHRQSEISIDPHPTAVATPNAPNYNNHIVSQLANYVRQPSHHQIRPINYQQRAAIPSPIFLHHSAMQHDNPNWAW